MTSSKQLLALFILLFSSFQAPALHSENASDILKLSKRSFQYHSAAEYTHIRWSSVNTKHRIMLLPIQNYTGVDIGSGVESWDYYEHGKIPEDSNKLLSALLLTSRKFVEDKRQPEYEVQFIIDQYDLPYQYAPDNDMWQKASDNLDRAFQSPMPASVTLTIKIESAKRAIKP